jgi:hypothetical protein
MTVYEGLMVPTNGSGERSPVIAMLPIDRHDKVVLDTCVSTNATC